MNKVLESHQETLIKACTLKCIEIPGTKLGQVEFFFTVETICVMCLSALLNVLCAISALFK